MWDTTYNVIPTRKPKEKKKENQKEQTIDSYNMNES